MVALRPAGLAALLLAGGCALSGEAEAPGYYVDRACVRQGHRAGTPEYDACVDRMRAAMAKNTFDLAVRGLRRQP